MLFEVAAAAIVQDGRVLAARRVGPVDVAGGWELPGGKVDPGETAVQAVVREIREELGCEVAVISPLAGRATVKPGYELTAHVARILDGEATPREHDAVRWLAPEELEEVRWVPSDRRFLPELRTLLLAGQRLHGGNVGGAVRVGPTVRRAVGAWTPAVHRLLRHLEAAGFGGVPRVLGVDELGREVLTYLPGRVVDVDGTIVPPGTLRNAMRWLREYHDAVEGFAGEGPWRNLTRPIEKGELICHHDFAPYNVALSSSATGERIVGVFDWDMAGPGTRLEDLAFAAWNWVPLHRPLPSRDSAVRLRVMADAYGLGVSPADIARGVVPRIEEMVSVIVSGQAAGEEGMLNLAKVGEPQHTASAVADLRRRMPAIQQALIS